MYGVAASVHEHAWSQSHPDLGCVGICEPDRPCHCGWAYSEEFPVEFSRAALVLLAGALGVSVLGTHGLPRAARLRRAAALAAVAYLAICPLNFSLSDWHGDWPVFYMAPLGLASFPLNLLAVPLMPSDKGVQFPSLGGDPIFGRFSTILAVNLFTLGVCAYLQWFVVVPWLRARARQWKTNRAK
jgi:peptidoglycan/LPS O-acetylase OafA/YrhL